MNLFKKIISGIREIGIASDKKLNYPHSIALKIQKDTDSVLSLRNELSDPTLSPSEAAFKKVILAMKLKKRTSK